MEIKTIRTGGITWLNPLEDGAQWYWGMDYTNGDLYEAEEVYRQGKPFQKTRLILVRREDGALFEPVKAQDGQYFGRPASDGGKPVLLLVDFHAGEIRLLSFDAGGGAVLPIVALPLSIVEDCYNLMPQSAPLMLTRHAKDDRFQILWPERTEFPVGERESFYFRDGDRLYFTRWEEDPVYREETVVRRLDTGEILELLPGGLFSTSQGEQWRLV